MSEPFHKGKLEAVHNMLGSMLHDRVDHMMTLREATDYGNRITLARHVLRGEIETESMTFAHKWERNPPEQPKGATDGKA